jgi:hypothetical protein
MKCKVDEKGQRILVLLKLDARRLFERIKFRSVEYLYIFSIKRTREHFIEIFRNRYDSCKVEELINCGQEVIIGLDQFYSKVDEIRWYLNTTNDMPAKVDDKMAIHLRELESYYEMLNLYIDAELGISEAPVNDENMMSSDNSTEASIDFSSPDESEEFSGPTFGSEETDFSNVELSSDLLSDLEVGSSLKK